MYLCLEFQSSEEVVNGFSAANKGDAVVFVEKKFSGTEFSVVVEAHGVAMRTSIVDDEDIAFVNFWQFALDGEFVAVFAEAANDVVNMVVWSVFFAKNGDMVVSAVHPWTHEVGHAGINADVVAIGVFVMDGSGNKIAVRAGYHAAAFEHDFQWIEACRNNDFIVHFLDQAGNIFEVHRILFWTIRDTNTAAKVNEGNANAGFFVNFNDEIEHHLCSFSKIFRV